MEVLNREQLFQRAPSIFATKPFFKMSGQYRFVPTTEVLNALQDEKFYPVYAAQSRTRIPGKGDFTRHVIRFRLVKNMQAAIDSEVPEIVLVNSHDGSSSYKVMLGFFRVVCGNGLVVCTSNLNEICTRHSGARSLPEQVIAASYQIVQEAPAVMTAIAKWKRIELSPEQQNAYAAAALELRGSSLELDTHQILQARRYSDLKNNLWNVFNNVQENLIKGGIRGTSANGRRMRTRWVKSVSEDLRLNRALWKLTEEMSKLVKR